MTDSLSDIIHPIRHVRWRSSIIRFSRSLRSKDNSAQLLLRLFIWFCYWSEYRPLETAHSSRGTCTGRVRWGKTSLRLPSHAVSRSPTLANLSADLPCWSGDKARAGLPSAHAHPHSHTVTYAPPGSRWAPGTARSGRDAPAVCTGWRAKRPSLPELPAADSYNYRPVLGGRQTGPAALATVDQKSSRSFGVEISCFLAVFHNGKKCIVSMCS